MITPGVNPPSILGSKLILFSHSYGQGGGATHVDRQFITLLAGGDRSQLRDLAVGASQAGCDQLFLNVATGQGGWAWVLQTIVPSSGGAPYTPGTNGLCVFLFGINDIIQRNGDANLLTVLKNGHRTMFSRICAARLFEDNDASVALSAGWPTKLDTNKNSGSQYRPIPGNTATVTITLPADFEGGTVAIGFIAWPAGDGTITFTGTASQFPAALSLVGQAYATGGVTGKRNSSCGLVARVTLPASDAGKTIICTMSGSAGTLFATPAAPGAITNVGTAGATTYTYERVYRTYNGDTLPSATTSTATGNATLSTTNYNQIPAGPAWPTGVEAELIVRTVGGTVGIVQMLTGGPAIVNDQANVAPGGAYAAVAANPLVGGGAFDYWQIESNNPATRFAVINTPVIPAAGLAANGITAANITNANAAIQQVQAEFADVVNQSVTVDVNTPLGALPANFITADNLHPNNRGHGIIAGTAKPALDAWEATIPLSARMMQSRVGKWLTGRALIRSPITSPVITGVPLWGDGATGFHTCTGVWEDVDGTNLLVAIDAQVGDDLVVELSGWWGAQALAASLDVVTATPGGATLNYFSSGANAASNAGSPGWYSNGASALVSPITGESFPYTVQLADLQTYFTIPGIVLVKLRVNGAAGKIIYTGFSGVPISMHLKNLGARNTPGFNAS